MIAVSSTANSRRKRDVHQFDHVDHRAEVAQDVRAEEGDDRADEIGEQEHQRHGVQADLLHVVDGGGEAEAPRLREHARELDEVLAEETDQREDLAVVVVDRESPGGPARR
jgi:hypothetical protein